MHSSCQLHRLQDSSHLGFHQVVCSSLNILSACLCLPYTNERMTASISEEDKGKKNSNTAVAAKIIPRMTPICHHLVPCEQQQGGCIYPHGFGTARKVSTIFSATLLILRKCLVHEWRRRFKSRVSSFSLTRIMMIKRGLKLCADYLNMHQNTAKVRRILSGCQLL